MSATQSAAPSRSLSASFLARVIAPRIGAAIAAFGLLVTANHAAAQQPFQVPAPIGPAALLQDPIEIVGGRMLIRKNSGGFSQIGFIDGVTSTAFVPIFTLAQSAQIPDPRLQRGGATPPTTVFFTQPNASGTRDFCSAPVGSGIPTLLITLGAGNWQLHAVNATSTAFFLLDTSTSPHRVARVTLGAPTFTVLGNVQVGATLFNATKMALSPNGLTLAIETFTSFFTANDVLTMSTATGFVTNVLSSTVVRSSVRWLDNRYLATIALRGARNQVIRFDSLIPGTVADLTQTPVQVEPSSDLAISDDRQWLTFVLNQTVRDPTGMITAPERTVVAMRCHTGTASNAGGAYIVAGDYRSGLGTPPAALTDWFSIFKPQIQSPIAGSAARIVFAGKRLFTDPSTEYFRFEVIDETQVTPRGVPGTTFSFDTLAPPAGVAWAMYASIGEETIPIRERATAPIPLAFAGIENTLLLTNPVSLFTVLTTPGAPASVPVTVPVNPALVGARFYLQGLWLNSNSTLHVSSISELPFF